MFPLINTSVQRFLCLAVSLLSLFSVGSAYVTTGTARPFISSDALLRQRSSTPLPKKKSSKRISYDLGLGKNSPLVSPPQTTNAQAQTLSSTMEHFVEHQAVHEYPSPYQNAAKAEPPQSAKKVVPQGIVLRRLAGDDVLRIMGRSNAEDTVAVAQAPKRNWDLNTPWVEMLIHEQQRKIALSGATN